MLLRVDEDQDLGQDTGRRGNGPRVGHRELPDEVHHHDRRRHRPGDDPHRAVVHHLVTEEADVLQQLLDALAPAQSRAVVRDDLQVLLDHDAQGHRHGGADIEQQAGRQRDRVVQVHLAGQRHQKQDHRIVRRKPEENKEHDQEDRRADRRGLHRERVEVQQDHQGQHRRDHAHGHQRADKGDDHGEKRVVEALHPAQAHVDLPQQDESHRELRQRAQDIVKSSVQIHDPVPDLV